MNIISVGIFPYMHTNFKTTAKISPLITHTHTQISIKKNLVTIESTQIKLRLDPLWTEMKTSYLLRDVIPFSLWDSFSAQKCIKIFE